MSARTQALDVDDAVLRAWPLPQPDCDGDKEDRGRVLVVAGSRETPGAAVLAGISALRAGAGKLAVATPRSIAASVAAALPEARVIALAESEAGGLLASGADGLADAAASAAAVLVGPGLFACEGTTAFVRALLPLLRHGVAILDAAALDAAVALGRFEQWVVMTPHAGEMAHLCGLDKEEVRGRSIEVAVRHAHAWNAVVALKGAVTCVAQPDGRCWRHEGRTPGLATSGSGDVLAGVIAGLAARGATPEQAAVWGVALHARAGEQLARDQGEVGYLARELPACVPRLMQRLGAAA